MPGLNNTGTCTCPTNTTGTIDSCERNLLVENNSAGVIAKLYLYDVILDGNFISVLAHDVVLIGQTSFGVINRPNTAIHEVLTDSLFSASLERKTFRNLRPD